MVRYLLHNENSDFPQTQLALLDDANFFPVVSELVKVIESKIDVGNKINKIFFAFCQLGSAVATASLKRQSGVFSTSFCMRRSACSTLRCSRVVL